MLVKMKYLFDPTAAGRLLKCQPKLNTQKGASHLRGRIPVAWLTVASNLPGRSLHVGVALWHAAGLQKSRVVPLGNISAETFGLNRNAKYRALQWLEEARLISVERNLGRAPLVTILDAGGEYDRQT